MGTWTAAELMAMSAPEWCYEDVLAIGTVTLMFGRRGVGKTQLATTWAIEVSEGRGPTAQRPVIYLAAAADISAVVTTLAAECPKPPHSFTAISDCFPLPDDGASEKLAKIVRPANGKAPLVVLDGLARWCGGPGDADGGAVLAAYAAMRSVSAATGATWLIVTQAGAEDRPRGHAHVHDEPDILLRLHETSRDRLSLDVLRTLGGRRTTLLFQRQVGDDGLVRLIGRQSPPSRQGARQLRTGDVSRSTSPRSVAKAALRAGASTPELVYASLTRLQRVLLGFLEPGHSWLWSRLRDHITSTAKVPRGSVYRLRDQLAAMELLALTGKGHAVQVELSPLGEAVVRWRRTADEAAAEGRPQRAVVVTSRPHGASPDALAPVSAPRRKLNDFA